MSYTAESQGFLLAPKLMTLLLTKTTLRPRTRQPHEVPKGRLDGELSEFLMK